MERSLKNKIIFFCALFAACLIYCAPAPALEDENESAPAYAPAEEAPQTPEKEPNEIFLDADEIGYSEKTGVATAEGNVKIRNKELRLFAPYAEYNSETNIVDAYSDLRENVVIFSGGDKFTGKHLKYNMKTRRGVLTNVSGQSDAMYMQGGSVRLMSLEEATRLGIVRAPRKKRKEAASEDVAEWVGVTSTTCDFTNPHYRLVTKKVIVFPGKKTVLKRPKFYLGDTLIMTYPFDYIAQQRKSDALLPIIRFNSDKGIGFGIKGPIDVGSAGEFNLAALYWTKGVWEARFNYRYEIFDSLFAYATVKRLYNSDTDDTLWRPSWGLLYEKDGWLARLWWAERDLVGNEVEPDVSVDYDVWRKPEFYLHTPWINDQTSIGRFRLFAMWGEYSDNFTRRNSWTERAVYGLQYQGTPDWTLGIFKPFYGARYAHYDYYNDDKTQDVTTAWFGFRYNIGVIGLSSSVSRRWGNSGSPMAWDRYSDSKTFSQSVSIPLPFGASWEKWTLNINGNYNLETDKISAVYYNLVYNRHCTTWIIWLRDKISDDEQSIGLTFYINAYPEYKIEIGSEEEDSVTEDF